MYETIKTEADFTNEEKELIEKLKERMENEINKNTYENTVLFYRILRARNFVMDDAEKMFRNMIQWRRDMGYEKITKYKPLEILNVMYKNLAVCEDKEGSNVFYVAFGNLDMKGLFLSARMCDIEKALFQYIANLEIYQEEFEKKNTIAPGYVHIVDCKNLTLAQATDIKTVELFIRLFKQYQDNYPERQKRVYCINTSTAFSIAFSLIKHILSPVLRKKIHVYHTDSYKEDLLKAIDEDKLPKFLGGTKTDPDGNPDCINTINHQGIFADRFYIHRSKRCMKDCQDVQELYVPKGFSKEVSLDVPSSGLFIEWEFETKRHDVQFGVFYQRRDRDGREEVVPSRRCSTDDFAERGDYECDKEGKYIAVFDNTYSYIRDKYIYYRFTVTERKINL